MEGIRPGCGFEKRECRGICSARGRQGRIEDARLRVQAARMRGTRLTEDRIAHKMSHLMNTNRCRHETENKARHLRRPTVPRHQRQSKQDDRTNAREVKIDLGLVPQRRGG